MTESISTKIKQRFCKDNNVNIQVFQEPYFSERLELYGYTDKWNRFKDMYERKFKSDEQTYFEYYNNLKDQIIDNIKESEPFKMINSSNGHDMEVHTNLTGNSIFKEPFVGKRFVSIDIQKANFSALVHYAIKHNASFNDNSYNYTKYMQNFTDEEYFAESKYIRQVVFGNCNPKRQIQYEKVVMNEVLEEITRSLCIDQKFVVSFCNDEIVYDITELEKYYACPELCLKERVRTLSKTIIPLKFEYFELWKVKGSDAYIKHIITEDKYVNGEYKTDEDKDVIKCNNPVDTIFIVRKLNNDRGNYPNDLVFYSQYGMAKLLEPMNLQIVKTLDELK